jgi:hypothetical protein
MAEEYLLKVAKSAEKDVAKLLSLTTAPSHIRLATLAPLSNYGYPEGSEGALLKAGDQGIVIGADGREDVPRDFVPWQNVSYVSDGSLLAKEQGAAAGR